MLKLGCRTKEIGARSVLMYPGGPRKQVSIVSGDEVVGSSGEEVVVRRSGEEAVVRRRDTLQRQDTPIHPDIIGQALR